MTATEIAMAFRSRLYLMQVVSPDGDFDGGKLRSNVSRRRISRRRHKHRALKLPETFSQKRGLNTTSLLVKSVSAQANPVPEIFQEVDRLKLSLIVAGSDRHCAPYNFLPAGTSAAGLRKARCPVLPRPAAPSSRKGK